MADIVAGEKERKSLTGVILAGLFCAGALALFFYTSPPYNEESYWVDYLKSYHHAGGAALVAGVLWFIFALLRARTSFFELDRKIEPDEFNASLAIIIIAVIFALPMALTKLPSMVPRDMPATESPDRTRLMKFDRNLKILVSSTIILTGLIVLSVPLRRLYGNSRLTGSQSGEDSVAGK